jgi:hypothetical protein
MKMHIRSTTVSASALDALTFCGAPSSKDDILPSWVVQYLAEELCAECLELCRQRAMQMQKGSAS